MMFRRRAFSPGITLIPIFSFTAVTLTTWLLFHVQMMLSRSGSTVRPFGIGFLVPVVVLARVGGWRAGLLTLVLSALASVYFLTPPYFSWYVQNDRDWVELAMLLMVGSVVIFAVEALRQNAGLLVRIRSVEVQRQNFLRDVLVSVTDGKLHLCDSSDLLPQRLDPVGEAIDLTPATLRLMRLHVGEAATAALHTEERRVDLVTATSECAMNAIIHASGGTGQVYAAKDGRIQIWVKDQGRGIALDNLPRATLEKGYTTAGTLGCGFKVMLQAADRLWLFTGSTGTIVVMEQDRFLPAPEWLNTGVSSSSKSE